MSEATKNKRVFVVFKEAQKVAIKNLVDGLPKDGSMKVTIEPSHAKRSLAQNNLYHMWVDIIANEVGYTHREMDIELKAELLEPEIVVARSGKTFSQLPSTSKMNTKEMSHYLDAVDRLAAEFYDIVLPRPEDLYYAAMGYAA